MAALSKMGTGPIFENVLFFTKKGPVPFFDDRGLFFLKVQSFSKVGDGFEQSLL